MLIVHTTVIIVLVSSTGHKLHQVVSTGKHTQVKEGFTYLDGRVDDPEEVVEEVGEEQVGVDGIAETPQVPAR